MGLSELKIELIKNKNIIFCPERKFQHCTNNQQKNGEKPDKTPIFSQLCVT